MSVNILIVSGKPLTTPKLQRIKRTGLFICSFQIRMTNERRLLDGGFTKNYLRKPAIIDEEIMRVSAFGEYAIYIANRIVEDVETIFIGKLKYDKFKKSLYLYLEDITRLPEPEEYIILDGRKIYRPKDPNPMPSSINESQKLDNLIDEIKMIEEVEEIDDGMPDEEPEEKIGDIMKIHQGDSLEILKTMPSESVDMVITSPPYYALRDYGVEGQIGLEPSFQEYLAKLVLIFDEVKRVLKPSGSCWVNLGDSYGGTGSKGDYKDPKNKEGRNGQKVSLTKGLPEKCLLQIPNRFAIMMADRGWIMRNEIIWHKPNCMPSSVKDRFTVDFEKLFFFVKNKKYYFEAQKVPMKTTDTNPPRGSKGVIGNLNNGLRKQDNVGRNDYTGFNARYKPNIDLMRNVRCVWTINTKGYKGSHFAVFPEELITIPIKSCCPIAGVVLDIFAGSGTTGVVCKKLNREFVGIELNPKYIEIAEKRIKNTLVQQELEI